jgi:hypothetical protein
MSIPSGVGIFGAGAVNGVNQTAVQEPNGAFMVVFSLFWGVFLSVASDGGYNRARLSSRVG